jgi:hypothetical protein
MAKKTNQKLQGERAYNLCAANLPRGGLAGAEDGDGLDRVVRRIQINDVSMHGEGRIRLALLICF